MNQLLQLKVLLLSVEEIMKIVIFLEQRNAWELKVLRDT